MSRHHRHLISSEELKFKKTWPPISCMHEITPNRLLESSYAIYQGKGGIMEAYVGGTNKATWRKAI